jgi:hypothetical protein
MKIIIKILFFVVIINIDSMAQVADNYYDYKYCIENNKDLYLTIDNKGRYSIVFYSSMEGSDIVTEIPISLGYYRVKKDTFILKDKLNSYNILLKRGKNDLFVIKGYPFILNKKLEFIYEMHNNYEFDKYFKVLNNNLALNKVKNNKAKTVNSIYYGVYYFKREGVNSFNKNYFSLEILKNGQYKYSLDKFLLSKGRWTTDCNLLKLEDENLKHIFYATILPDSVLLSSLLIIESGGILFKMPSSSKLIH